MENLPWPSRSFYTNSHEHPLCPPSPQQALFNAKLNSFSNHFSFTIEGEEVCSENWHLACVCFLFDLWPSCPSPPRLDTPKMRREDSTNSLLIKWVRLINMFTNCLSRRHFSCTVKGKTNRENAYQNSIFISRSSLFVSFCNKSLRRVCAAGVLICFSWAWWHAVIFLSSWVKMWWN